MHKIYRKTVLLFVIVLLFGIGCRSAKLRSIPDCSQSSGCDTILLDNNTQLNLEVLARVWGYVKYHHPAASADSVNMDHELFGLLPRVVYADPDSRNTILREWVQHLGPFESKPQRYTLYFEDKVNYRMVADLDWVSDTTLLGTPLSTLLSDLRCAMRPPYTKKDSPYADRKEFDCGYRILALFRYWNIIEYYYPNKHLLDKDWNAVLKDFIPLFITAGDDFSYRSTVCMLIACLNDAHADTDCLFLFGHKRIPVRAHFVGDRLIVFAAEPTGYVATERLQRGDEILAVGGRTIGQIMEKTARFFSIPNRDILKYLTAATALVSDADSETITYSRNSVVDSIRYGVSDDIKKNPKRSEAYKKIDDSIGYINAELFQKNKGNEMMEALKNTKALIVDLRGYPKETMTEFVCRYFLSKGTVYARGSRPEYSLPGCFHLETSRSGFGSGKTAAYQGQIVVLVNARTGSHSEYVTVALQANPKTRVVGSMSAGSDGNIFTIVLPGSITTHASGFGIYYPDGGETQRVGVRIDYPVESTLEGVMEMRDEQLEAAIRLLTHK